MNIKQREALNRLEEILCEVSELGAEARDLVKEFFPAERNWCDAYGVFQFGESGNPYDNTMEKLLENIENNDREGEYDEQ
jgi:hypothetical protein